MSTFRDGQSRGLAAATAALSLAFAADAFGAGAVVIQDFDGGPGANVLAPGGSLSVTGWTNAVSGYSDNPALNFSAWAHVGDWWTFELSGAATVSVSVTARDRATNTFQPGFSLYASGSSPFDGGTTGFGGEISDAGWGTPHSFNATGSLGSRGTLWMANGSGGNMQELLGYAVSGPTHASDSTGWDESIDTGAHDASVSALFESGVTGSVAAGYAAITVTDLKPGWYTLFVSGTDHASTGGEFDIGISAVPLPAGVPLLGSALIGLGALRRRRSALRIRE
jgi:hypothetical protein